MERLSDNVYVHTVETHGYTVACAVVVGSERVFVFDTLDSPESMAPVKELVADVTAGRRLLVVNSHHHWDHVYGNAAFAGADLIAHRSCGRLIVAQSEGDSEKIPLPPAEGVPLPTIGFGDRVRFTDATTTVHLIRTPGHSPDSIIMYLDEQNILFGGDTVEYPFPTFAQRDAGDVYLRTLRQLNQLPVKQVVPGHGPVMGKEIVDMNQRYVEDVYDTVRTFKESGTPRSGVLLPVEEFLSEGAVVDDTYRRFHRENVEWVYDEV
jgi:cyclase